MESLANYGSDDESGDYSESVKNDNRGRHFEEDDANYDEIGMDESSEESNNNHAEHFSSLGRERRSSYDGWTSGDNKGSNNSGNSFNPNQYSSSGFGGDKTAEFDKDQSSRSSLEEENNVPSQNLQTSLGGCSNKDKENSGVYETKSLEDTQRRHSSDMEMDDGGDDLDNYVNTISTEARITETMEDFRQKYSKSTIFTKGKGLGEEGATSSEGYSVSGSSYSDYLKSGQAKSSKEQGGIMYSTDPNSFQSSSREDSMARDVKAKEGQKLREKKEYDQRDNDDNDRRRDDYRRKDDRDDKKIGHRRDYEDKTKESEREKRRDDKEKRRSPDRREYGKKRSHSPDKRDKDRDRERERERDRDRGRDRDRDRSHRSSDRRSPKHSRRSSRSPDRSWKARKLEKKAAVLNKLGIELKTDVSGNWTPRQLLGEQLKSQIQEVEAKTGVTLPTYYNPGVMNPLKYAQQIQKRKLLWGNKSTESKPDAAGGPSTAGQPAGKQWVAATFKGDSDGKMTEKFKRLMGIKDNPSPGTSTSTGKPPETKEIIQKQEELFSNMEAQYQVARMATHTHRGVGLGFGTFQVPPR